MTGGAQESINDNGPPNGPHTSSVNIIWKLMCGPKKGAKGRVEETVDTAHVVWFEVIALCGFWDGSCDNGNCGACTMFMACSEILGWFPFYKKCGLVSGQNSLDADFAVVVC